MPHGKKKKTISAVNMGVSAKDYEELKKKKENLKHFITEELK